MLFCFDCLMKSVRITASRHDTSGKFINDQDLIIFYYIILVTEHQIMCTQCQNDVVLDLQVLRVSKVLNMEELLNLLHTLFGQVDILFFFIDNEVSGLFDLFSHNGIHLREFPACFTSLQLSCQNITCFVKSG